MTRGPCWCRSFEKCRHHWQSLGSRQAEPPATARKREPFMERVARGTTWEPSGVHCSKTWAGHVGMRSFQQRQQEWQRRLKTAKQQADRLNTPRAKQQTDRLNSPRQPQGQARSARGVQPHSSSPRERGITGQIQQQAVSNHNPPNENNAAPCKVNDARISDSKPSSIGSPAEQPVVKSWFKDNKHRELMEFIKVARDASVENLLTPTTDNS